MTPEQEIKILRALVADTMTRNGYAQSHDIHRCPWCGHEHSIDDGHAADCPAFDSYNRVRTGDDLGRHADALQDPEVWSESWQSPAPRAKK